MRAGALHGDHACWGAARTLHAVRVARRGEAPVQAPVQAPVHVPLHTLQPGDRTCRDRDRDKSPACACSSAIALVVKSNVPAIRHYGLYDYVRSQSVPYYYGPVNLKTGLSVAVHGAGRARAGPADAESPGNTVEKYALRGIYAGSAPRRRAGQPAGSTSSLERAQNKRTSWAETSATTQQYSTAYRS